MEKRHEVVILLSGKYDNMEMTIKNQVKKNVLF